MKAFQDKLGRWVIDLEFSAYSPRKHVLRDHGDEGNIVYFASEAEALAKIAELESAGEQARIFKHDPAKATAPVEPLTPRRGRPPNGK